MLAIHIRFNALSCGRREVFCLLWHNFLLLGIIHHSFGERVLRECLNGSCCTQEGIFQHTGRRQNIRHNGMTLCQRACFIQNNGINFMCNFQTFCGFYQNPIFRTLACADHDCRRRCQTQCAGAGDHQNRNTNRKGKGEGLTDKHPHDRCDNGNRDDGRDENAADLICQLGNGCLRGTRFLN